MEGQLLLIVWPGAIVNAGATSNKKALPQRSAFLPTAYYIDGGGGAEGIPGLLGRGALSGIP